MMKKEIINSNINYCQISVEKYVPKHLICLLKNFNYIFCRRYLIIKKKPNSEN